MRKRYITILGSCLVGGFALLVYGMEERVRSLQWQGIGLMTLPVLVTLWWLIRRLARNRKMRQFRALFDDDTRRMIDESGYIPPHS